MQGVQEGSWPAEQHKAALAGCPRAPWPAVCLPDLAIGVKSGSPHAVLWPEGQSAGDQVGVVGSDRFQNGVQPR